MLSFSVIHSDDMILSSRVISFAKCDAIEELDSFKGVDAFRHDDYIRVF